jgi:hypothetical protein
MPVFLPVSQESLLPRSARTAAVEDNHRERESRDGEDKEDENALFHY